MKKLILGLIAVGVMVAPVVAKEPKKPADYSITVTNSSTAALTAFNITEVVPAAAPAASVATTEYGKVQGSIVDGVESWKGIPFAAPPVDAAMKRAPSGRSSTTGICVAVPGPVLATVIV